MWRSLKNRLDIVAQKSRAVILMASNPVDILTYTMQKQLGWAPGQVIIRYGFEMIKIKRVYDKVDESDGYRIWVDRLWPRGLTKSEAQISDWQKTIAPSEKLRKWYARDVAKWTDFKLRYFAELTWHVPGVQRVLKSK